MQRGDWQLGAKTQADYRSKSSLLVKVIRQGMAMDTAALGLLAAEKAQKTQQSFAKIAAVVLGAYALNGNSF